MPSPPQPRTDAPIDLSAGPARARLVPGASSFDTPDGRHIVATPGGEFVELALDADGWAQLRAVLHGTASVPTTGRVADALTSLASEGLVADAIDAAPAAAPFDQVVVLTAGDAASTALHPLLAGSLPDVEVTAAASDVLPVDDRTVVVACADRLPDTAWCALDDHIAGAGGAWHRCWREGATAWLGPLSVPGASPSYRDLRTRRLAASSWPVELEASWRDAAPAAGPDWSPATAAAVAAAITADLVAWRETGVPDAAARAWRGYDPATRHWHAHPVLPVPRNLRQ